MRGSGTGLVPALVLATLVVSLVATLGTPLIPTIAAEYDVSLESAQWVLTITLLVGTVATPVLGRLADGARRTQVLIASMAIVLVGCVIAATAGSFAQMLVGRALMGVGWGAAPTAIAVAREHLDGERRRRAIPMLSVMVAVGAGLGFPVTALIADGLGVEAAFWAGAIATAGALAATLVAVPRSRPEVPRAPLDLPGATLLAAGLAAGLVAVSKGATWGWGSTRVIGLALVAAAALAAWTAVELRHRAPLVDLRLLSQRAVLAANLTALLIGVSVYMCLTLANRLTQTPASVPGGIGGGALLAGLLLMPMSLGSLLAQPLTRNALVRFGFRAALPGGAVAVGAAAVFYALAHATPVELGTATLLVGIGVGSTFAAMPALIVACVPPDRTGSATGANQVLRTVGGAVGSALAATVLTASTAPGAAHPPASEYTAAFALAAGIAIAGAAATFALVPRRRASAPPPGPAEPPAG